MDPRAFDELSKKLAEKTSRGRALKVFGGALVGGLFGAGAAHANPPEKHCKFQGYNCGENTDCCSLNCCNRTCCGQGQTCCGGQCVQCPSGQTLNTGTCQCEGGTSPPPPPPPGGCTSASQCPQGSLGDCRAAACVGGTCTFVNDDSDVPTNCTECQTPTCTGGTPSCVNVANDTPCSIGVCQNGECVQQAGCGDGICGPGEDASNCPQDCPGFCGDGTCNPFVGENCQSCPQDCGVCTGSCPMGGDECAVQTGGCASNNPNCFCVPTTEGFSRCVDYAHAACPSGPTCASSMECPNGQVCIMNTIGTNPLCCPNGIASTTCANLC